MTFTLDRDGGAEVLKELCADTIRELALQVGQAADDGAKVSQFSLIGEYVSDRFVATVTVPAERQAKDGALTRAAAAAGLEVRLRQTPAKPEKATKPAAAKRSKKPAKKAAP